MGSTGDNRQERRAFTEISKMKNQTNSKKSGRRKEECSRGTQKLPGRAMGGGGGCGGGGRQYLNKQEEEEEFVLRGEDNEFGF